MLGKATIPRKVTRQIHYRPLELQNNKGKALANQLWNMCTSVSRLVHTVHTFKDVYIVYRHVYLRPVPRSKCTLLLYWHQSIQINSASARKHENERIDRGQLLVTDQFSGALKTSQWASEPRIYSKPMYLFAGQTSCKKPSRKQERPCYLTRTHVRRLNTDKAGWIQHQKRRSWLRKQLWLWSWYPCKMHQNDSKCLFLARWRHVVKEDSSHRFIVVYSTER